jgi:hypothetical protein
MSRLLYVPGVPENANARTGWVGAMRNRSRFRELTAKLAREEHEATPYPPKPFTLVTVRQTSNVRRKRDPGGVAEKVKPLLDGLVDAGWLPDDDEDHIELRIGRTVIDKSRAPGMLVELEESTQ